MKRLVAVLVGFGILMFGFQNCSQQPGSASTSYLTNVQQSKVEDPNPASAVSIDILTQSESRQIKLDLNSGKLTQTSDSASEVKCLSESQLAAIRDLMENSSLCEFQPKADEMCAQIYTSPYANIHWSDKSIQVGEAVSSCQKAPDLCGQDGKTLRGLLKDVIERWGQLSCDFQAL